MPSIHFLLSHIQINSVNINKEKAFYIVDPGSDLTHTREKFQSLFEKQKKWNGIIGELVDKVSEIRHKTLFY
jgi:hypothetical protein